MSTDTSTTASVKQGATNRAKGVIEGWRLQVWRVALVVAFLAIWQLVSSGLVDTFYVSSPGLYWDKLTGWLADGTLWDNSLVTINEALSGWVLGAVVGIACGFTLGRLPSVYRVVEPFIAVLNATPRLALAPLFIVWFGLGFTSKLALIFSVVFFVLLINVTAGTRAVERDYLTLVDTMGASRWQAVRLVVIPSTLPWAFAGLRLALAYSFAAAVVSEFVASTKGLGHLIATSGGYLDITGQLTAISVLLVVVYTIELAMGKLERYLLRYQPVPTATGSA